MRINDMKVGLYSYQNQVNRTNVKDAKKPSYSDNLSISSTGQEISQAVQSDQADRQKRVQELKKQISDGTYQMDTKKIAEKMVDFWKK